MEWLYTAIITAVLTVSLPLAWTAYSERRKRALIQIHYWWEEVIDTSNLWLAPQVRVGLDRAVGTVRYRLRAERSSDAVLNEVISGVRQGPRAREAMVNPAFRLDTPSLKGSSVWVIRVVIKNTSRRWVVTPEDFGEIRFTIDVPRMYALGWRKDILAYWPKPAPTHYADKDDFGGLRLDLQIPSALAPRDRSAPARGDRFEDSFAVVGTHSFRDTEPSVVVQRTTSMLRMRVKPWRPSTTRPLVLLPARIMRWIRESYSPRIYV